MLLLVLQREAATFGISLRLKFQKKCKLFFLELENKRVIDNLQEVETNCLQPKFTHARIFVKTAPEYAVETLFITY
jgi:hypothetical protein